MTEREIPDGLGFLFGGMTDSETSFAPPASSEPEIPAVSGSTARIYSSRREARAAGAYSLGAVAAPGGAEAEATQAMDVAAILGLAAATLPTPPTPLPSPAHAPAPWTSAAAPAFVAPAGRIDAQRRVETHPRSTRTSRDATAAERKTLRQRITGTGVMLLVGGLFMVLALPAYADNNATSLTDAIAMSSQRLTVTGVDAVSATGARDTYTATSAKDLKKMYSDALRQQNIAVYMQSGAKAQGDDYPWFADLSRNQGGSLSPLNFYYRECVDFVAWRLNRDAGSTSAPFKWTWSTLTPSGGNASQWKSAWLNHGWPTGTTPKVGAVAWFSYNHVAYVSGIMNDGTVVIEEYNQQGNHLYDTRIIQPGDAYYLYAPPA